MLPILYSASTSAGLADSTTIGIVRALILLGRSIKPGDLRLIVSCEETWRLLFHSAGGGSGMFTIWQYGDTADSKLLIHVARQPESLVVTTSGTRIGCQHEKNPMRLKRFLAIARRANCPCRARQSSRVSWPDARTVRFGNGTKRFCAASLPEYIGNYLGRARAEFYHHATHRPSILDGAWDNLWRLSETE